MNRETIFQQVARGALTVEEALASLQQGEAAIAPARLPLSEGQRALWAIHEMVPGNTAYHVPVALQLRADADPVLLEQALSRLGERHPMLRARIRRQDGEAAQEIAPGIRITLEREDVSLLAESYLGRKLREASLRPLDLEAGPSWRAALFTGLGAGPVLLLVFHHLFVDGVSIPIFLDDLAVAYAALRAGCEPAFAPLQASYGDYVAQQRRALAGPEGAALRRFWQSRFDDLPPRLLLPTDRPRPPTSSLRGAHYRLDLPEATVRALEAVAERLDATPFLILLATWLVLLRRYTEVQDLAVGIPAMSRPGAAFERVIGYFSNMVVIRRTLEDDAPFEALVRGLRETVLDAVVHSDYPFATLVREVGEATRSSSEDFFRVGFYFQSWLVELERTTATSGLWTEYLPDLKQEGEFELVLDVHRFQDVWRLYFKYNPDLYEEAAISRMGAHYRWLLEQVIADASRPLAKLEIVTPAERRQLLGTWNQTSTPSPIASPIDQCVHEIFALRAAETPDRIAARCGDASITYRTLHERSHRLAALLQARGVRAGDPVGILIDRSLDLVVGLLGIMKSGGAYVPLDPIYPPDRLAFMLEDSGVKLLLTRSTAEDRLPPRAPEAIWIDRELDLLNDTAPLPELARGASPEGLVYIIYTSGSTGKPKGVPIRHRSLTNLLHEMARAPGFTRDDRMLAATTICFDISNLELFLPLFTGGELLLLPDQAARDGVRLKEILESGAVTVAQATPATWRMVMAAGWNQRRPLKILCGGEAMPPDLAEVLVTHCDELWNMYGPTEATVWATTIRVRPGDRITVGRPLGNTRIYVLDRRLELVPAGIPGEIYIGGEGLSPGYLRRPDLDEQAFVPSPFGDADAPMLYKTGDLGRLLPDGRLECFGRADHQVKIRGFRVELGEIDVALQKLPGVRMATAVVREDTPGHPHLAAFLVPEQAPLSAVSMRDTLGRWLPPYMVPQTLVWLKELPLNPSRKFDRPYLTRTPIETIRARYGETLAEEEATEARAAQAAAEATGAPRSLEAWIEQRCQSLLRTSGPLDREQSLFALGLNSILVTALRVAIQEALGIAMPLAELARGPSIQALARWIGEQHPALPRRPWSEAEPPREHAPPPSPPLPSSPPDPTAASDAHAPFPLTPIQEAYLAGRLFEAEADRVGCHIYLEIEERDLDVERLCRAFQRLVDGHQALRTVILPSGRQQVLEGPCRYQPDLVDLSTLGDDERAAALAALRARMDHRLYDPYTWPLFAVTLVRLDHRTSRIHLSIDNLFVDGSSLVILLEQWSQLYREPTSILRLPGLSFRDYCVALGGRPQSPERDADLEYWQRRLEQAPRGPSLPYLPHPDRAADGARRRRYSAELDERRWAALQDLGRRSGVTATTVLLTAFQQVLRLWSEDPAFSLVLTLFHREPVHPDVDRVVGSFTSTAVFHADVPEHGTLEAQARRIHAQLWEDLEHQSVSGVVAMREYHRRHRRVPSPIPVVFTSLVGHLPDTQEQATAWWSAVARPEGRTQTPQVALDHQVFDAQGRLHYFWDVEEARFQRDVPAALFRDYQELLERLADDARAWHTLEADLALPRLLHTLFQRQALRRPGATALIAGELRLDYATLQRRAAALAHHLRDQGLRRGELCAVVADKGWEQVVAVLAVLMAGGAYVPIEPGMPPARLAHLLQVTEARFALTRGPLLDRIRWPAAVHPIAVDRWPDPTREIAPPPVVQRPTDLAYVIFTSGSSGEPKGVMLDHRGPVNTLLDVNERLAVGPEDRALAVSALGFDLSVYDLFGLLAAGGAVVMPTADQTRDPMALTGLVEQHRVTLWNTVPAYVELIERAAAGSTRLHCLKWILMSGDWIPVALPDRLRATCPAAMLFSLGGATEASIWSILFPIGEVDPAWKSIPYGAPLRAQPWCLLDDGRLIEAQGSPAQLHIGGIGLAKGYWKDAERTRAAFIAHPITGERIYATGDLGMRRADGVTFEFLGRIDHQVKLNGFRIELGEIEAALGRHPGVEQALVALREDRPGARCLAAYLKAGAHRGNETRPQRAELSAFLGQWLPSYMIPTTYTYLEAFPLSENGKVDRRALPPPAQPASSFAEGRAGGRQAAPGAAANAAKTARAADPLPEIARLASELLGTPVTDPELDLFELGATSLTIMRLVQGVYERFGVKIPAVQLFESPRLGELVRHVAAAVKPPPGPDPATAPQVLLTHEEREQFKSLQRNLRSLEGLVTLPLAPGAIEGAELEAACFARVTHREFDPGPVPLGALSRLLESLRPVRTTDGLKYQYPSAGSLYPLQVYLEVRPERVEGLDAGIYYYHPLENRLGRVQAGPPIPAEVHFPHNRAIHRQGAFTLHLVAQMDAIEPLYGEAATSLVTLDAGYLGQHLLERCEGLGIGLCAIGGLDFDRIRAHFQLDPGHRHVHALIGGGLPEARRRQRGERIAQQVIAPRRDSAAGAIAIVGLAGRYPGAHDLDGLWDDLLAGRDRVSGLPADRGFHDPRIRGGFLDQIARFDPLFFRISPHEAERMDPQERLFLETAWHALEDAGYTPGALRKRFGRPAPIGVYAGVMSNQYALCGEDVPSFYHAIANRVSWCLDLSGPSLAVDTACSSSLTAIHLAVEAIRAGTCRWALAGGVNLSVHPSKFHYMDAMRFTSPSGRCQAFGAGADGMVSGEGVGAVLLKPLEEALADGDPIHAVILGSALNHTGKTRAFTVPDSDAQGSVVRAALRDAGVDPATVSYVEAHGTGTALGDPIELRGLKKAWAEVKLPPASIGVGSLKSSIGHLESAAGVASLTRVILQMRHRTLAPTLHAQPRNPDLDLDGSPFFIVDWPVPWQPVDDDSCPRPLRAGISSFGAAGANAHLVVEAFEAPPRPRSGRSAADSGPWLFVLSARSEDDLRRYARGLLAHLERRACWSAADLCDLAFTFQVGRQPMAARLAVLAPDAGALQEALRRFADGLPPAGLHAVDVPDTARELDAAASAALDLEGLAGAWLAGVTPDWAAHPMNRGARRISAPVYPFGGERYWVGGPAPRPTEPEGKGGDTPICFRPEDVPAPAGSHRAKPDAVLLWDASAALALVEAWRPRVPVLHLDPTTPEALPRLLSRADLPDTHVWVHGPGHAPAQERALRDLLRCLAGQRDLRPKRLVFVTFDAAHGFASLAATLSAEWPGLRTKVVCLDDPGAVAGLEQALFEELCDEAPVVSLSAGAGRRVRSFRIAAIEPSGEALSFGPGAGVLVTGGLGGLGYRIAEQLARDGVSRLVLMGRSPLDEAGRARIAALESRGARALYLPVDVTDAGAMTAMQPVIRAFCPDLRGVIHCAGIQHDRLLKDLTSEAWEAVLAPRLEGTRHLDRITADFPLDFFVVCGSILGLFGGLGQGAYAHANGLLNDLILARAAAEARGERRGRSLALNWPFLSFGGMVAAPTTLERMAAHGLTPLPDEPALEWLRATLAGARGVVALLYGDPARIRAFLAEDRSRPAPAPAAFDTRRGGAPAPGTGADPGPALLAWLRAELGEVLKLAPERIDLREPFESYGLDSIMIHRLNAALEVKLEGRCSKTLFFEHATLEQVGRALLEAHPAALERAFAPAAAPASGAPSTPVRATSARPRAPAPIEAGAAPIAVIGLAGRYPEAPDLDRFWANLEAGRDCVGEVPRSRWDVDTFFDPDHEAEGKTYTRWGAFLAEVERFDHRLFQISPREARAMDPQERLFLETAWATLEDAGVPRRRFLDLAPDQRNPVAVFAGVTWGAHQLYAAEQWALGNRITLDSSFWSIANRVSWFFNFHGPSMPVDTACSASLSAIALACDSLARGDVEMALAGGVNLYLHPSKYVTLSRQGFASSDGRCRGFGLGGDGYVPGEGVGAVLLKPLDAAERDGDFIHGVIRGWALNHGGHTHGYSVPNPRAQAEVVRAALRRAGVEARSISYVEAHGTGTALGDPIELAGLHLAYGWSDQPFCGLGTVKSNIGHLESAAGIAGLTKVLLQMRHRRLVPTLHVERLNPNLDLDRSPFRIQRSGAPWLPVDGAPLRAGISSFGAGGANAHLIVESYEDARGPAAAPRPQCLVLSARSPEQLRRSAAGLQHHLARHAHPLSWIGFTLQTCREPMSHRLALLASSREEAITRLEAFLADRAGEEVWQGQSDRPLGTEPEAQSAAAEWLRDGRLAQAAREWVKGREIPWTEVHPAADRRRVPLPTYPFGGERLWAPDRFPTQAPAALAAALPHAAPLPVAPDAALLVPGWEPAADLPPSDVAPGGTTLVLVGDALADRLDPILARLDLADAVVVRSGVRVVRRDDRHFEADLDDEHQVAALLDLLPPGSTRLVDLLDLDAPAKAQSSVSHGRLRLLRAWIAAGRRAGLRLIHVHGPLGRGRAFHGPAALMAGLVPVLDAEYTGLSAVDLELEAPESTAEGAIEGLRRVLRRGAGRLRMRDGGLERPVYRKAAATPSALTLTPDRVYVISGASGGIGMAVAEHLAARGARKLGLLERRAPTPGQEAALGRLESMGVQLFRYRGSLLDPRLDAFLRELRDAAPIGGLFHAAGWNRPEQPAFIHKETPSLDQVFEPKIQGLLRLAERLSGSRLGWVVLCSSVSAAIPALGVGMSDYAAANAWMDAFAASRDGLEGTRWHAIQWPNWLEVGMGATAREPAARYGIEPLTTAQGTALLDWVLASAPGPVVLPCLAHPDLRPETWLRPEASSPSAASAPTGSLPSLEAGIRWVRARLSAVLELPEGELSDDTPFDEFGLDSILLVSLLNTMDRALGLPLHPSTVLEHDTVSALSRHLCTHHPQAMARVLEEPARTSASAPASAPAPASASASASASVSASVSASASASASAPASAPARIAPSFPRPEPIAVIGAACHFPGSPDLRTFWENLKAGRHAIREVPSGRWDTARFFSPVHAQGKTISRWGGFLDGIELFDPDYFGIREAEAVHFDPLVRQFLEVGTEAIAAAGYSAAEIGGRRVGVYAGARVANFSDRIEIPDKHSIVGLGQNFIAAHLSHFFDLRGPNLVIDSACSSSLVAVHQACLSLQVGETDLALAGGVDLLLDEKPYLMLSESRALSPDGRCYTFDQRANGFVPGEGCGAILLKRLTDALADGDRVLSVIEGSAVNNDGRTMGVTTPNPEAQTAVVREALRRAGAAPDTVTLIEAHGTGTMIGDPIELRALTQLFRESTDARGFCGVGSVKTNLGHLASAAGIAGLIKVILCLQHRHQVPTLNCTRPNPRFDFEESPFLVLLEGRPWAPRHGARRGGVSAFGFGGTNAHVVLCEAPEHAPRRPELPAPAFQRRRLWPEPALAAASSSPPRRRPMMKLEFPR